MQQKTIAFIGRAARYSPNSVGKDTAILAAVRRQLLMKGYDCMEMVREDGTSHLLGKLEEADAFVSMGRMQDTLNWLGDFERRLMPVINCTASVMICNMRRMMMQLLEETGISVAPRIGGDGYWVKRGYGCAESKWDVQYAANYEEAGRISEQMQTRGIVETEVRAHVKGDLLKFYGVRGTDFFRCYYPGDDGQWKFEDESRNGHPHHYHYDAVSLHQEIERAVGLIHLDVYGGDCIIRPDGQPVLIDLNDWPSFSRCLDEAAKAIGARISQMLHAQCL